MIASEAAQEHRRPIRALLLSPLSMDSRIWGGFGRALAREVNLVTADWPGHGPSSPAGPPTSFDLLEETDRIAAETNGLDLAIATGNEVAAAVHLANQGSVRSVILIGPSPDWPMPEVLNEALEEHASLVFADVPGWFEQAIADRDARALAAGIAHHAAHVLDPRDVELAQQVLEDNGHVIFSALDTTGDRTPWQDTVSDLRVPILCVAIQHPERDRDGYRLSVVQALVDRCSNGRLVTIDAESEFPWLEKTDDLLRVVLDSIDKTID